MLCSKSANSRQSLKIDTNNIGVSYMDTQFQLHYLEIWGEKLYICGDDISKHRQRYIH